MLRTPHNVKFKIMNYGKDLDKIFRQAGICSRNYTRSTTGTFLADNKYWCYRNPEVEPFLPKRTIP